jgi:hypothetical protein
LDNAKAQASACAIRFEIKSGTPPPTFLFLRMDARTSGL